MTGPELCDEMQIKAVVLANLLQIAGDSATVNPTQLTRLISAANERTNTIFLTRNYRFSIPEVQIFPNEMERLPDGHYRMMCRVTNPKNRRENPRTYYVVLSSARDKDRGFPIHVYKESEYERFVKFDTLRALPQRSKIERDAIARHVGHEVTTVRNRLAMDEYLAKKMKKGEYAVSDANYSGIYWNARYVFHPSYEAKLRADVIAKLRSLDIAKDVLAEIENILENKPLVIIAKSKKERYPLVQAPAEDGSLVTIEGFAHSSDNAVYLIEEEVDTLAERNIPRAYSPIRVDGGAVYIDLDRSPARERQDRGSRYFYEATVHLGLLGVYEGGKLQNILTKANDALANNERIDDATKAAIEKLQPVDRLSETLTRDHAAGPDNAKRPERVGGLALTLKVGEGITVGSVEVTVIGKTRKVAKLRFSLPSDAIVAPYEKRQKLEQESISSGRKSKAIRFYDRKDDESIVLKIGDDEVIITIEFVGGNVKLVIDADRARVPVGRVRERNMNGGAVSQASAQDAARLPVLAESEKIASGGQVAEKKPGPESSDTLNEPPVASTGNGASLSALAVHDMVNALISRIIHHELAGSGTKLEAGFDSYDGFLNVERSKNGLICWFGYDNDQSTSFLDIFNRLAQINASQNGRSNVTLEDEIAVITSLSRTSGIYAKIDKKYVNRFKAQLFLQIEHFGVRNGTIYAMKAYINDKEKLINHVRIERGLHQQVLNGNFDGQEYKYEQWRTAGRSGHSASVSYMIHVNAKVVAGENEEFSINRYMSYNEFVLEAHAIAERLYPMASVAPQTRIYLAAPNRDGEIPVAAVNQTGKRPAAAAQAAEVKAEPGVNNPFLANMIHRLKRVAGILRLSEADRTKLLAPYNVYTSMIKTKLDDGREEEIFTVRVKDTVEKGKDQYRIPAKGGLRFILPKNLGEEFYRRLNEWNAEGLGIQDIRKRVRNWVVEETKALAAGMTLKNSLVGLPLGGGKGTITLFKIEEEDGKAVVKGLKEGEFSDSEYAYISRTLSRDWMEHGVVGPELDVPAPDVNTNGKIMAWIVDELIEMDLENKASYLWKELPDLAGELEKVDDDLVKTALLEHAVRWLKNHPDKKYPLIGTYTGKPLFLGGSEVRDKATALGTKIIAQEIVKKIYGKDSLQGLTVAIQGFGNAGQHSARLFAKEGCKIVAVSDSEGAIYKRGGFSEDDLQKLYRLKEKKKTVSGRQKNKSICDYSDEGITGVKKIKNEELLELDVQMLIPAALENVITAENADRIKARVILEAANGPTTIEADEILRKKGIDVASDSLASAGGVTVSYLEMLQNFENRYYSSAEIEKKLKTILVSNFKRIWDIHERFKVDLRTAGDILSVSRIFGIDLNSFKPAQAAAARSGRPTKEPGSPKDALFIFASNPEVFFGPQAFTNKDHEACAESIGHVDKRTLRSDREELRRRGYLEMITPGLYRLTDAGLFASLCEFCRRERKENLGRWNNIATRRLVDLYPERYVSGTPITFTPEGERVKAAFERAVKLAERRPTISGAVEAVFARNGVSRYIQHWREGNLINTFEATDLSSRVIVFISNGGIDEPQGAAHLPALGESEKIASGGQAAQPASSQLAQAAARQAAAAGEQLEGESEFLKGFLHQTVRPVYGEIFEGGDREASSRMRGLTKGDQSPVSVYDPLIERKFYDTLASVFPEDGIWGEELAGWRVLRPRMWTIDPIDGTVDFLNLGNRFGTLIAFYELGNIKIGAGYWPRLNIDGSGSTRLLARADREGILLNDRQVVAAETEKMNESKTVIIGCHPEAKKALRDALKRYFEKQGMNVIFSTASGGEIAEMMLRGTARLFIHLTPAVVDAPTNAFFAEKLGLKVSDRNGNPILQMPFQYLQEGLFFDSLVIGTAQSHAQALEAFQAIGEPEEDLPWTEFERTWNPVLALKHYNDLMRQEKGRLRSDPYLPRKKAAKKRELQQQVTASVRGLAQIIRDETDSLQQLLVQENTYRGAVLDPDRGALRDVVDVYRKKSQSGKSTLVSEGGAPGAGKTMGGKNLAEEIARRTGAAVPVLKEDNFLLQRNLRVGSDGKPSSKLEHKFQWDKRDQVLRDLGGGRSVMKPMFDDVSGGNLLLSLDKDGKVVIHNGNRNITIAYKKGDHFFSYDEILTLPKEAPVNLAERQQRRHINITDSGLFVSGSTKVRIYVKDGRLMVGLQSMEIVTIEKGEPLLVDQLTEHMIDFVSENEARVTIQVPQGHDHLRQETNFTLSKVIDPKKTEDLLKAKEAKEFLAAGTPVVFEGQFAFLTCQGGRFVRDYSRYDVSLNYRAPRMVRWTRDMLRSLERGRTTTEVEDNIDRFYERAWSEEHLSVPAGVAPGIIQVNTTDLAQSALRLILYGREGFPMYRRLFEQMGIEPRTIDAEQRRNIDEPVIRKLLASWADTITFLRSVDGIDEYKIGKFVVRVDSGRESLSDASIEQNKRLCGRTNRIIQANSLVDLTPLGAIFKGKKFGVVSVWNNTELLGDRLRKLAAQGDENSIGEGESWIDEFIEQEQKLNRRGIVDSNPDIMEHRRLSPVHGEITVTVVSPERNLKMGRAALELYRSAYIPDQNGENVYTRPDIIERVPAPFRDYYRQRVMESLGIHKTLRGFFKNEFERTLPAAARTPVSELPADLVSTAGSRVDIVSNLNELRNWGVEHPAIFAARIDNMRLLYTRYFIDWIRKFYFPSVPKKAGTPQLAWAALFVNAYPDRYSHFYQLASLFYEQLLDNPFLLDEERYRDNSAVHEFLLELYRKPYELRGIKPPFIEDYSWQSFDIFLNQARMLGSSWVKRDALKGAHPALNESKITVRDAEEYRRLSEYLERPYRAVVFDLDGTVTRTDSKTNRVLPEFQETHNRIIGVLAERARSGNLVAATTNRRKDKAAAYSDELVGHPNYGPVAGQPISPETRGSYVEVYYGSGMGGMDAGLGQEFKDFELSFPAEERTKIIDHLLGKGILVSRQREHVEDLGNKINLYITPGTDRQSYARVVSQALEELGYLGTGGRPLKLEPTYVPIRLLDGGEGVFTIIPAEANKARAKEYVKKRHGFTEDDLLVLVDQPQPGAVDEALVHEGGITVDEENTAISGLISTKKAIGLTGPEAALWCLEHANFIGSEYAVLQMPAQPATTEAKPGKGGRATFGSPKRARPETDNMLTPQGTLEPREPYIPAALGMTRGNLPNPEDRAARQARGAAQPNPGTGKGEISPAQLGKELEAMKIVIALSPALKQLLEEQGWFTLRDFLNGREKVREAHPEFGWTSLNEDEAERNLEALAVDDGTGDTSTAVVTIYEEERPYRYSLTFNGANHIEDMRLGFLQKETRTQAQAAVPGGLLSNRQTPVVALGETYLHLPLAGNAAAKTEEPQTHLLAQIYEKHPETSGQKSEASIAGNAASTTEETPRDLLAQMHRKPSETSAPESKIPTNLLQSTHPAISSKPNATSGAKRAKSSAAKPGTGGKSTTLGPKKRAQSEVADMLNPQGPEGSFEPGSAYPYPLFGMTRANLPSPEDRAVGQSQGAALRAQERVSQRLSRADVSVMETTPNSFNIWIVPDKVAVFVERTSNLSEVVSDLNKKLNKYGITAELLTGGEISLAGEGRSPVIIERPTDIESVIAAFDELLAKPQAADSGRDITAGKEPAQTVEEITVGENSITPIGGGFNFHVGSIGENGIGGYVEEKFEITSKETGAALPVVISKLIVLIGNKFETRSSDLSLELVGIDPLKKKATIKITRKTPSAKSGTAFAQQPVAETIRESEQQTVEKGKIVDSGISASFGAIPLISFQGLVERVDNYGMLSRARVELSRVMGPRVSDRERPNYTEVLRIIDKQLLKLAPAQTSPEAKPGATSNEGQGEKSPVQFKQLPERDVTRVVRTLLSILSKKRSGVEMPSIDLRGHFQGNYVPSKVYPDMASSVRGGHLPASLLDAMEHNVPGHRDGISEFRVTKSVIENHRNDLRFVLQNIRAVFAEQQRLLSLSGEKHISLQIGDIVIAPALIVNGKVHAYWIHSAGESTVYDHEYQAHEYIDMKSSLSDKMGRKAPSWRTVTVQKEDLLKYVEVAAQPNRGATSNEGQGEISSARFPVSGESEKIASGEQAAEEPRINRGELVAAAEEVTKALWGERAGEHLDSLAGAALGQPGLYADSLCLLSPNGTANAFIANNGQEDVIVFAYTYEEGWRVMEASGRARLEPFPISKGVSAPTVGNRRISIFKFNPNAYRNVILRNPETNINEMQARMAALRYAKGRAATALAITPASEDSIFIFLKEAQAKGFPLVLIFSEPQVGAGDAAGYFGWVKKDTVRLVDGLIAKMGVTIPVTIERDHGSTPEDLPSILTYWNSALLDNTKRNAPEDTSIQAPGGIYELYKDNIMLLADEIQAAERIQSQTGIPRGFEIGITEVGKEPTPPSHIFYFLYYLHAELERRGVTLRPSLAEAQIGTIHGYGAENLANRGLLQNVAAMMGIFHIGEAAHGTSGTTGETLSLYPKLGVAHAHIFTDLVVAEFRAILKSNPDLFLRYSKEVLELQKTRKAFDSKTRARYKVYNGQDLALDMASYEQFVRSGRAEGAIADLMNEADNLPPDKVDRRRYADSNIAFLWFVLQNARYLASEEWVRTARRDLSKEKLFRQEMENCVGAEIGRYVQLFNNVGVARDMAQVSADDLSSCMPVTVAGKTASDLIEARIAELNRIILRGPPKASSIASDELNTLTAIPFIRERRDSTVPGSRTGDTKQPSANLFALSAERARRIAQNFKTDLETRGMAGSSLSNIVTESGIPTGMETGTYYYIDLGGTNLRVGLAEFQGNRTIKKKEDEDELAVTVPREIVAGGGKTLFEFISRTIKAFVEKRKISGKFNTGFTFSFAMRKEGVNRGIITPECNVKGYIFNGVFDQDVVTLLKEALPGAHLTNVEVEVPALPNDTEAVRDTGAYLNGKTRAGGVFATGHNTAIRDRQGRSVNLESGAFDKLEIDKDSAEVRKLDAEIDRMSSNPGVHLLEKRLSAKYVGPLVGLKLEREILGGRLFTDYKWKLPVVFTDHDYDNEKHNYQGFAGNHVSEIENRWQSGGARSLREYIRKLGIRNPTLEDAVKVRKIAHDIMLRSAQLGAAEFAGIVMEYEQTATPSGEHAYAIDGSLLRYPGYIGMMKAALADIFGKEYADKKLEVFEAEDGAGIGAALTAMIVSTQAASSAASTAGAGETEQPTAAVQVAETKPGTGGETTFGSPERVRPVADNMLTPQGTLESRSAYPLAIFGMTRGNLPNPEDRAARQSRSAAHQRVKAIKAELFGTYASEEAVPSYVHSGSKAAAEAQPVADQFTSATKIGGSAKIFGGGLPVRRLAGSEVPAQPALGSNITQLLANREYEKVKDILFESASRYFEEERLLSHELAFHETRNAGPELQLICGILKGTPEGQAFLNSEAYAGISGVMMVRLANYFGLPLHGIEVVNVNEKARILAQIYAHPEKLKLADRRYIRIRKAIEHDRKSINVDKYTIIRITGRNEYLVIDRVGKLGSYIMIQESGGQPSRTLLASFHPLLSVPISTELELVTPEEQPLGEAESIALPLIGEHYTELATIPQESGVFNLRSGTAVEPIPTMEEPPAFEQPEFGEEQTIAEIDEIANVHAGKAGLAIPTGEDRYTLLVDANIFKGGERAGDIKGFVTPDGRHIGAADRFDLEEVNTASVENILAHVREIGVKNAGKIIIQVSRQLTSDELAKLKAEAPELRVIWVDTTYFRDGSGMNDNERRLCRFDLYAEMLAARRVTLKDIQEKNSIYRTVEFFIKTHMEVEDSKLVEEYIDALARNIEGAAFIINHNLSFRPAERLRKLEKEYHAVAIVMISA